MKRQLAWCLCVGLIGSVQAGDAMMGSDFSNGPKLYVGGSVGSAKQSDTCNDPFFSGECDNEAVAWKAFGGARINPMLGAEIGYYDLGDSNMNGTTGGSTAKLSNSTTGSVVAGVGYVPISPQLEAFGKAGAMAWESKTQKTSGSQSEATENSGTSILVGGGAQFQLNSNLHLRGEWEHLLNIGADSTYETDADLYSLGVSYSTL
ncbi:MAG: hypothetical protein BWK73_15145 [Thiothrix lacustris]|uniref:Outer membrane protein OmpA-like transmembrane domain-containing protein n=1 Tax=Thiothrix lacustris TaxID=525917 RepID=A0A1Y1QS42_9GAMM|nr:MAG: hypothetical protein BWK73_15145 [Thiothrix lacustris]